MNRATTTHQTGSGETASTSSRRRFLAGIGLGTAALTVPAVAAAQPRQRGQGPNGDTPFPASRDRRSEARRIRMLAADIAADRPQPEHIANGDEQAGQGYAMCFTKGLPHDPNTGLVARTTDYEQFVRATSSGIPADFINTPLGPDDGFLTAPDDSPVRAWESQAVGLAYSLIGPDPQAVTMPPAPGLGSTELAAEMAELYAQATLRDKPLAALRYGAPSNQVVETTIATLNGFDWFDPGTNLPGLDVRSIVRRRQGLTPGTAFRGVGPGDDVGPYLSQLLLAGTGAPGRDASEGLIRYGAQTISQRVRRATTDDFLTSWDRWLDVQNGLAAGGGETYNGASRFITTARDLATYVHSDALYQPYLNACLLLFANRGGLDQGMPFQQPDGVDHQRGFVFFGGPHVLSMLSEVCSRALKAVKYQKFNVHRRLRPEAMAARIEKAETLNVASLRNMRNQIEPTMIGEQVKFMNDQASGIESMLLPMAYSEGSPMHPSYGAGHGAVAGACATVLKALFDHTAAFTAAGDSSRAFIANTDGSALDTVAVTTGTGVAATLTVEGEINKLASNISIGRDWAGVHYFSDCWESLLFGQTIALQILEEQKLTIPDSYELTVPLFEGGVVTV